MKLQIGIIGCGRPKHGQARHHVKGWLGVGAEVVALCDIAPDNAAALRDEFSLDARLYTDWNELLQRETLDFLVVCLWPHLHAPVVLAAADARVRAIHCEKPVAPRLDEAREMVKTCAGRGVQLSFNHQRRFLRGFQEAKRLLDEGAIGELDSMEAYCADLFDWGTHWFDLMLGFNDQNPVAWVMGQVEWREPNLIFGVPVEQFGIAHFACENGVRGTLVGSRVEGTWNGERIRLIGSRGMIEIGQGRDGKSKGLRLLNDERGWQSLDVPIEYEGDDPYPPMTAALVSSLESGVPSIVSGANALQATELIFAAYESARLRERVTLPLGGVTSHPLLAILREHDALPEGVLIR